MKLKYWSLNNFFNATDSEYVPQPVDEDFTDFITRVESDGGVVENKSGLESLVQMLKNIE